jgi:hypothetical protein
VRRVLANSIEVVAGYLQGAPVLGLVRGFGTVVPAEFGFRAEGVRIAALFDIDCSFTIPRRDLERLAHAYSVPLLRPISAVPDASGPTSPKGGRRLRSPTFSAVTPGEHV